MRLACGPGSRRRGARPEVTNELRQAAEQLRAEQRAAAVRRSAARRQEQEVRRKAREQAAAEREQTRRARAALGATCADPPRGKKNSAETTRPRAAGLPASLPCHRRWSSAPLHGDDSRTSSGHQRGV